MIPHSLSLTCAVGVLLVILTAPDAFAQNGHPPEVLSDFFTIEAGDPNGSCAFPVSVSIQGRAKFIGKRGHPGLFIVSSPGLNVTFVNLSDPTKEVTLNITGSLHVTKTSGDAFLAKGRNLLIDPTVGIVISIGNVSIRIDQNGHVTVVNVKAGRLVDVCELLE